MMNLAEMQQRLADILGRGRAEPDSFVGIRTSSPGIPHNHISELKAVVQGFDWTAGKIILVPADELKLVPAELKAPSRQIAESRLAAIRESYAKLGFDYGLPKAREQAWIDGFVEGIKLR